MCGSGGGVFIIDAEGLAYPPRGRKLEFKLERYPPLDGASCVLTFDSTRMQDDGTRA